MPSTPRSTSTASSRPLTVGSPNQFDGLIPAVVEGCHVVNGVLEYGPCNDPFGFAGGTPNSRGQTGYLNTYNLNQWGDNLHTAANDQIATSTPITLGENAVLTVWAYGGGSGTHAPTYDPDPTLMYTNGSCGIAVLLAEDYSILASVKIGGQGTLQEDTLDLSAFAGQEVLIEVVDAFDGAWGWLAVDEIQISNTDQNPVAGFICQLTEGELAWGFDAAQVDHLISLGYDVDVISHLDLADGTFTKADADAYDVLVISESPNSNGCNSIIGTSAPMMHQEAYGWDNNFFMGAASNIHWLDGQTQVEVVNDTHPIIVDAGFPVGKLPWFTAPEKYTTENISNMAPGAELLVKADAEESAVVFAIEKGGELANGNLAAGRVVGFSISGAQDGANQINGILDASIMADEQWALYDAALRWLNPPPSPPTAALIVSATDLSAGFDQAQYDRLESLGYDVTVATGDDVSGGVFTVAEVETFDVLVVSESIGSSAVNNFIGANVPMMHQESYGWSRHYFTAGLKKAWIPVDGPIDIVNDHAIITDAGLSVGPLDFFTAPTNATSDLVSALAPGAVNLAQVTSDANDFTLVFAIEQGAELSNGTPAANRVVGFSLPGTAGVIDASVMTDEAWAFFDAAILWLDAVD